MTDLLDDFIESVETELDASTLIPSEWLQKHFSDPKDGRKPWSFEGHEWQIEVVNETGHRVDVEKAAQTGCSVLQIRAGLCFVGMHEYVKVIYTLPTAGFASEFSSTRLTPAIESSPFLTRKLGQISDGELAGFGSGGRAAGLDNQSVKRFGNSYMLMRGCTGTASISVDADMRISDEVNFSDPTILGQYASRLQHSDYNLEREFSTPTLPGYGISVGFLAGSQALRMVHCDHCGQWTDIDFFRDCVIPGWSGEHGDARKFRFKDKDLPGVRVDLSYLRCSHCGGELTYNNLADPEKRLWVDRFPDRRLGGAGRSFSVGYWDVPKYNPTPAVLMRMNKYRRHADWVNFVIGQSYQDDTNSVSMEAVDSATVIAPCERGRSCKHIYIGCDLGKTNSLVIGVPGPSGTLDIVWFEEVTVETLIRDGRTLAGLIEQIMKTCVGDKSVVDTGPDYTVSMTLASRMPGKCFGAEYVENVGTTLDIMQFNENSGVVKIERTPMIDEVVGAINGGEIRFPIMNSRVGVNMELIKKHLKGMKKVVRETPRGPKEFWEKVGDEEDHFWHGILYCWVAFTSVENRIGVRRVKAAITPGVAKVPMKEGGIDLGNGGR